MRIPGIPCAKTESGPDPLRFLLFDSKTLAITSFFPAEIPAETPVAQIKATGC